MIAPLRKERMRNDFRLKSCGGGNGHPLHQTICEKDTRVSRTPASVHKSCHVRLSDEDGNSTSRRKANTVPLCTPSFSYARLLLESVSGRRPNRTANK